MNLFVDTWGWIVLADKKDPVFKKIKKFYITFIGGGGIIYSTDYVLNETITLLFRRTPFIQAKNYMQAVLNMVQSGHLQLEQVTNDRFHKAWNLRNKYQDKPYLSFTDLTSFVVMRELGIVQVLTGDNHFKEVNLGFTLVKDEF